MKQTIKKSIALVLTLVMLLGMTVTVANAQESGELKDGDLIKKIDFTQYTWENSSSYTIGTDYDVTATADALTLTSTNLSNKEIGVTAKIDGLTLKDGDVYTIDFSFGHGHDGYGIYMLLSGQADYSTSVGMAAAKNKVMLKENGIATTVGTAQDVTDNKITEIDGIKYRNYRLFVDVTNKIMKTYVLVGDAYVATTAVYENCNFGGTDFYLTFRAKAGTGKCQLLHNMSVYKGDLMRSTTVEVNCDGKTETKTIDGYTYTLPTQKKAGYVFAGWKVNDATTPTPAGTVIPTEGLTKLTAVFEKIMSKTYLQFGNSNATAKTTDVRIVSLIDTINYKSVGYKVSIKKAGSEIYYNDAYELKYIYTALSEKYGGAEITLSSLGYGTSEGYFTALTLKNVSTDNADITVELTPYQIDTEGNKTEGQTIVIDLDAKWAEHSAAQ